MNSRQIGGVVVGERGGGSNEPNELPLDPPLMADECTDVATIEEMSVFCHWEEGGSPEEHFFEIVHLKQANTESLYSAPVESLKEKQLQVSKIVGMGFDEASAFLGKKTGVQTRIKKLAPHALFVHCHCHSWLVSRLLIPLMKLSTFT